MIKRLKWVPGIEGKIKKYYAINGKDEYVGNLEYERTGRFMHWCWNQRVNFKMSPGCVEEMRLFQKKLGNTKTKND